MFQNNSNREKQVILLMIPSGKGWHYHAVEKLTALLRGITSKHHVDVYCFNCLHSFATKNKIVSHKNLCENKDFCNVTMSSEDAEILEFNQHQKSEKEPFIIYADLQCVIEKIDDVKIILKIHLQQK